ncbi:MAG: ParB N-terminal domain-containing protein [Pseudomonadota bacterium]
MMQKQSLPISAIYVPAKRKRTLEPEKVESLAEEILEDGQKTPIRVRKDGDRFVLIEGYHRLEAVKALGEEMIDGYLVQARRH